MMFRATIIRGGKWQDNLYFEEKTYGDFPNLKRAVEWVAIESTKFRGGWNVTEILIKEGVK